MSKKGNLKISYILQGVLMVIVVTMWFMEIPGMFWMPIFVIAMINAFIGGFLFIDLISDKK